MCERESDEGVRLRRCAKKRNLPDTQFLFFCDSYLNVPRCESNSTSSYSESSNEEVSSKGVVDDLVSSRLQPSGLLQCDHAIRFHHQSPRSESPDRGDKDNYPAVSIRNINSRVGRKKQWRGGSILNVLILTVVLSLLSSLEKVDGVCVWQGGVGAGGYRLACGFRQSALLRLRTLGGLKGYIGAGFTVGDEDGFRDSLSNTDPAPGGAVNSNLQEPNYQNTYQRVGNKGKLVNAGGGNPLTLSELKKQEQLRYLQQIQTEQLLEHQIIAQQKAMQHNQQRQQKEMQMFQRREGMEPSQGSQHSAAPLYPTPPPAFNQNESGLTKRASMWSWPFQKNQNSNQNNAQGGNVRMQQQQSQQVRRGPPGPVPYAPQQRPQQQQQQQPYRSGPPPSPYYQNQVPSMSQYQMRMNGPPSNMYSHPPQQQGSRQSPQRPPFQQQQQYPRPSPNPFGQRQGYLNQEVDYEDEEGDDVGTVDDMRQQQHYNLPAQQQHARLPQQVMVPPPSPSNVPTQQYRQMQYPPTRSESINHLQQTFPSPYPSQVSHAAPSHPPFLNGGQMLRNPQNFGPSRGINQHQPSPSSGPQIPMHHHQQQQQQQQMHSQLHRYLPLDDMDEEVILSGIGALDKDALATAVYDPNVFPDIYFTTTEKGNGISQFQDRQSMNNSPREENNPSGIQQAEEEEFESANVSEPTISDRKKKRRRKKFRLLKKKGQLMSVDVGQELDTNEDTALMRPHRLEDDLDKLENITAEGEVETDKPKKRRRKMKGRRRKRPLIRVKGSNNETLVRLSSGEMIREAISSAVDEDFAISGPSYPHPPTTTTTTTTTSTTTPKMHISMFNFKEALENKEQEDYDENIMAEINNGFNYAHKHNQNSGFDFVEAPPPQIPYDPRFPPDHEVNKGRAPSHFRKDHYNDGVEPTTATPFGSSGLNLMSPSYSLDAPPPTVDTVKFSPSTELSSKFVRFDSRESLKSVERTRKYNDQFYSTHYNRSSPPSIFQPNNPAPTAFSHPGFYDFSPSTVTKDRPITPNSFNVPSESPHGHGHGGHEVELPWERNVPTSTKPVPIYGRRLNNMGEITSPSPSLKDGIFGGDDRSSNWEAPNFWGTLQQVDRYGPNSDFVTNDNFKRILESHQNHPPQEHNYRQPFPVFSSSPPSHDEQGWGSTPSPSPVTSTFSSRSSSTFSPPGVSGMNLRVEKIPVKEFDIDGINNFISSTTTQATPTATILQDLILSSSSTTESPQIIHDMRNNKKSKNQKRPEVQIKIKGETPSESGGGNQGAPSNQEGKGSSSEVVVLPNTREVTDILASEDMKGKGSVNVGQHIALDKSEKPSPNGGEDLDDNENVAHFGFNGQFPPPNPNPFANFNNNALPKNPLSPQQPHPSLSPEMHAHRNHHQSNKHNQINRVVAEGVSNILRKSDGASDVTFEQLPVVTVEAKPSEGSPLANHHHPNQGRPTAQTPSIEHGPRYEIGEPELPSIVPSPPDPILNFGSVTATNLPFPDPSKVPILRPPAGFDQPNLGNNLRWEKQKEIVLPSPLSNLQPIPQPPSPPHQHQHQQQQTIKQVVPNMQSMGYEQGMYKPSPPPVPPQTLPQKEQIMNYFKLLQQNSNQPPSFNSPNQKIQMIQYPQQHQHQQQRQQQQQNYHPSMGHPQSANVNMNGQPPSIKLVNPGSNNNAFHTIPQQYPNPLLQQQQQSFRGPFPQSYGLPQSQMIQQQQRPNQHQLMQVPPKSQFQKFAPPKKYVDQSMNQMQQQQQKGIQLAYPTGQHQFMQYQKNNIALPQNPFMSNNNNFKTQQSLPNQPTKIPPQKFQPPPLQTQQRQPQQGQQSQQQQQSPNKSGGFLSSILNPFKTGLTGPSSSYGMGSNIKSQLPPQPSKPKGVEVTYVDLDNLQSAPKLVPQMPHGNSQMQQGNFQNQHGNSQMPRLPMPPPPRAMSDKEKVMRAIQTLNNVKYDVIQSVAEEQFGPEILERIKAKKKADLEQGLMPRPSQMTPPTTTARPFMMPLLTTMAPFAGSLFNSFMGSSTARPSKGDQRMSPTGLSNLLSSFGGYGDSAFKGKAPTPSMVSLNTDAITNLFNSMGSGEIQRPTTTTPAPPPKSDLAGQNIKSLQAQIAKAILAKATRKKEPSMGFIGPSPTTPLGLLNSLALSKNYTQSQIATLKKLIALNNLEQKLNSQLGLEQTTPKLSLGPTIKSLLAPSEPSQNSIFSNKMLRDPDHMLNSVQSNSVGNNAGLDPTLLALKALALKKAQSIQYQTLKKDEEKVAHPADFKPIPVDLSAILSPAPPVEEPRRRRLMDIRNAPRSFYPANATLGFDNTGSTPGSSLTTTFDCDRQGYFPGLYADPSLGCKVFHLCAKTDAGYLLKSFRCPKETVFDQEVLKCNWSLYVECEASESKYHFNKYLSQSFQFLKTLGEFRNATGHG